MPYTEAVESFCDNYQLLSRKGSLALHKNWVVLFQKGEPEVSYKTSLELLRKQTDTEFFALFDYEFSHVPPAYKCTSTSGMVNFEYKYTDFILINSKFTWTIVFHHEHDQRQGGPLFMSVDANKQIF